jgi:hypothetical protein
MNPNDDGNYDDKTLLCNYRRTQWESEFYEFCSGHNI